ncbi:MAG: hypothetical protein GX971_05190 [Firmicutes bacterium]|nr:hypothetical protein [Bacillota bacterium]
MIHVRRVNGTELTDEQMLNYYSGLAERFGGRVKAQYRNAICLVVNERQIYQVDQDDTI